MSSPPIDVVDTNRMVHPYELPGGAVVDLGFDPTELEAQDWEVVYEGKKVQLYRDGVLCDGPNGEPAWQWWYPDGQQQVVHRFRDGVLCDGANGEPAWQWWYPDGQQQVAFHYQHGELCDGANGEPAEQRWYPNE